MAVFASECEIMDNLKAAVYEYCIVKAVLNNILPADMNIFDQQYSYHISCYIFIFWYFDLKIGVFVVPRPVKGRILEPRVIMENIYQIFRPAFLVQTGMCLG